MDASHNLRRILSYISYWEMMVAIRIRPCKRLSVVLNHHHHPNDPANRFKRGTLYLVSDGIMGRRVVK